MFFVYFNRIKLPEHNIEALKFLDYEEGSRLL